MYHKAWWMLLFLHMIHVILSPQLPPKLLMHPWPTTMVMVMVEVCKGCFPFFSLLLSKAGKWERNEKRGGGLVCGAWTQGTGAVGRGYMGSWIDWEWDVSDQNNKCFIMVVMVNTLSTEKHATNERICCVYLQLSCTWVIQLLSHICTILHLLTAMECVILSPGASKRP